MEDQQALRARLAPVVIRLVGAWILFVALMKLFKGTPADLPKLVQDFWPSLDLALKLKLSIAIELSTAVLALLRPRWGWLLQVPMLSLFVVMLVIMTAQGEKSCGCFGKTISMPPMVMLAIDGTCLAAILYTRPWSSIRASAVNWIVLAPALAAVIAAPWIVIESAVPQAVVRDESGAWRLPEKLPDFLEFNPRKQGWLGKPIRDTELGVWMDTDLYPQDATWILYRVSCPHCGKELADLAASYDGQAVYVLVRMPEKDEEKFRQVFAMPPIAGEAILPELTRGYVGQTPWTLKLEGGIVVDIKAGEGVEDEPPAAAPAK